MTINELLSSLNDEQIKPVLDTEGAVLVIAGAGSGKTRVLTTRIAYLILEKGVSPARIMAITFTNKAAEEMKNRLNNLVGNVYDMWVSTIHSMCVRILRRDIDKLGYDKNFTIYDETDKDKALKRVIEGLGYETDKYLKIAKNAISAAKNDCVSPADFKVVNSRLRMVEELTAIYEEYNQTLEKSNALDFDDLLFRTYELFVNFPEVADYYAEKFQYIHIDEFQDTNKVQFSIAEILAKKHGNLFAVGDDDQSIYGFRGAKIENILSFENSFRGAKIYKLERNYRSTKKILELANCIIKNNRARRDKTLYTENSEGVRVETFVGTDEENEATYAALQIKNLMARYGYRYSDFAVFMRINALSRAFEQEFANYNIPYRVFGGFRFFERKEIKDVLSYLKIINNDSDDEAFLRCISVPKRGIGEKTLKELREYCASNGFSLYDGVKSADKTSIGAAARIKLNNFRALLDGFKVYSESHTVPELMKYILEATAFKEQFDEDSEENASKLYNISELLNSADQFARNNAGSDLADYLNSITLSSDTDAINSDDAVTVATIHAAKGLEYKCVFVAGLDEKVLPIMRTFGDENELEEERRLVYVAVTRAMERLYLTRAMSRFMYGNREHMHESRFLQDARAVLRPETAYKKDVGYTPKNDNFRFISEEESSDSSFGFGFSSGNSGKVLGGSVPKENKSANFNGYRRGIKVKHVKFGEGTVIDVKGNGENITVDVAFKGVGIKSLSVKFAPMEIIDG